MKHKESKLKESIRESLKKVLKESFREDFFDWYDFLSPEEQHRVDTWCEEEGYPEFLSDCSNSELEIIMDHFNPDFFESKDTKKVNKKSIKESVIDTSDFSEVEKELYDGIPEEAFMNLPDGSPALEALDGNGISSWSWIISGNSNGGCTIWYIDDDTVAHKDYENLPLRQLVSIINSINNIDDEGFTINESKKVRKESKKSPVKKLIERKGLVQAFIDSAKYNDPYEIVDRFVEDNYGYLADHFFPEVDPINYDELEEYMNGLSIEDIVDYVASLADKDDEEFNKAVDRAYGDDTYDESKKSKKTKKSCRECDKTIKEGKLHPFTQTDWYAWAGAEDFEDSPPYIYEDPETGNTIIVSGNSGNSEAIVEVDIWKDDDQSVSFYREDYNSKEEALADAEDIIATGGLSGDLAYFDSRTGWVKNELGI